MDHGNRPYQQGILPCRQYGRLARYYDEQIMLQEQAATQTQAQNARDDTDFRNSSQLKPTRREWDLNRPDALLIDRPARQGDDDPRCGMSSMQTFAGEDLSAGGRSSAQKAQCMESWEQQALEKAAAAERERQLVASSDLLTRHCDKLQRAARKQEEDARRDSNKTTLSENMRLVAARKAAAEAEAEWECLMNSHEIESALASTLLSEDPSQAVSSLSAGRVRKDHWKGMSSSERQAIVDTQFRQVSSMLSSEMALDQLATNTPASLSTSVVPELDLPLGAASNGGGEFVVALLEHKLDSGVMLQTGARRGQALIWGWYAGGGAQGQAAGDAQPRSAVGTHGHGHRQRHQGAAAAGG
jgi:hypothetical protein